MYSSQNLLFLSCKSLPVIVLAYTTSRSQKDLMISDPSDVSFDMIRLAGTVRCEAVCGITDVTAQQTETFRKHIASFCSIVISFCAGSTRIDTDFATVMKCVLINSHHHHHHHACCIL